MTSQTKLSLMPLSFPKMKPCDNIDLSDRAHAKDTKIRLTKVESTIWERFFSIKRALDFFRQVEVLGSATGLEPAAAEERSDHAAKLNAGAPRRMGGTTHGTKIQNGKLPRKRRTRLSTAKTVGSSVAISVSMLGIPLQESVAETQAPKT